MPNQKRTSGRASVDNGAEPQQAEQSREPQEQEQEQDQGQGQTTIPAMEIVV